AGVGAAWIVEHQAGLVKDAEFLLNEGGLTRSDGHGNIEFYGIGTTEKSPFWLDVTAHGTAGHGSRPTPDNPVHRLVRALDRIANWQTPLTVTPAVERSFRDLAGVARDTTVRRWLSDIRTALRDSEAARAITADLTYNAVLRNTISITGLKGSDKTNVGQVDRKSTRLNSSHDQSSYAVFCLKKKDRSPRRHSTCWVANGTRRRMA